MQQDPNFWVDLLKTFGLPTVLLLAVGYVLYETNIWVRGKFTDLVEKCAVALSDNATAFRENTEMTRKIHDVLDKRQPGSL